MPKPAPHLGPRPLTERLRDRFPTPRSRKEPAMVKAHGGFKVEQPEELEAIGVAIHLLEHLSRAGATRLSTERVVEVRERLMRLLDTSENMRLEVEAYQLLDQCLPPAEQPDLSEIAARDGDTILYDSEAPTSALLYACLALGADVKLDYFSKERGEMNTRVVTPHRIVAETYLQGFCHARKEERTFRLQRITRCIPIGGKPKFVPPPPPAEEATLEQLSLLDFD
jgi:predicted DNA-binding transcriptional regulator YafY